MSRCAKNLDLKEEGTLPTFSGPHADLASHRYMILKYASAALEIYGVQGVRFLGLDAETLLGL